MTTMNGAKHDVEDILASIRTSIADRSPFEAARREAHVTTLRGKNVVADEAMEFELPAIFKPSQPAPERPNLLGRLSEALSQNAQQQDWDRSRVIPFEPAHGRMIEPPPPVVLEIVKEKAGVAAQKISSENDSVKRNMTTFFDTRMTRMGGMGQPAAPAQSEPAQAEAHPPKLPSSPIDGMAGGGVEDAAAQLLRPILKEWLSENMPKIVEKALRPDGK